MCQGTGAKVGVLWSEGFHWVKLVSCSLGFGIPLAEWLWELSPVLNGTRRRIGALELSRVLKGFCAIDGKVPGQ